MNLQNADVLFAIDRAGLVPGDGETHQGIYDVGFFSQFEMLPLYAPCNYNELRYWMRELLNEKSVGPRAIRYARGAESKSLSNIACSGQPFDCLSVTKGAKTALVTYGAMTEELLTAAQLLEQQKLAVDVYKVVRLNPIPPTLVQQLLQYERVFVAEDAVEVSSFGAHLGLALQKQRYKGQFAYRGVPTTKIDHATVNDLRRALALDGAALVEWIKG